MYNRQKAVVLVSSVWFSIHSADSLQGSHKRCCFHVQFNVNYTRRYFILYLLFLEVSVLSKQCEFPQHCKSSLLQPQPQEIIKILQPSKYCKKPSFFPLTTEEDSDVFSFIAATQSSIKICLYGSSFLFFFLFPVLQQRLISQDISEMTVLIAFFRQPSVFSETALQVDNWLPIM